MCALCVPNEHFIPSISFTFHPLSILVPKCLLSSFRQEDLFELFLNTHTHSREVSFFMMPVACGRKGNWQDDKEVHRSGGFVHLLAPTALVHGMNVEMSPFYFSEPQFVLPKVGLMMDPTLWDAIDA